MKLIYTSARCQQLKRESPAHNRGREAKERALTQTILPYELYRRGEDFKGAMPNVGKQQQAWRGKEAPASTKKPPPQGGNRHTHRRRKKKEKKKEEKKKEGRTGKTQRKDRRRRRARKDRRQRRREREAEREGKKRGKGDKDQPESQLRLREPIAQKRRHRQLAAHSQDLSGR